MVEYESLDRDSRGQIGRVMSFLGLDASSAQLIPSPRLARQSDGVTARWRRQMNAAVGTASGQA